MKERNRDPGPVSALQDPTAPALRGSRAPIGSRDLLDCAVAAARAAGNHAADNVDRRTDIVRRAKHDVKLRLDIECQAHAASVILARYPGHRLLGEEDETPAGRAADDSEYEWIVDPIDGTVNFSHGLRRWCCSVAVRRAGHTLAGAVFAPALGDLYTATADGPALCNGGPLRVSTTAALSETLVYTGVDKTAHAALPAFAMFRAISANVQKTRVTGSAALDLCDVAAGRGDAYFESGIFTWDIAAGGLLVERAGGKTENLGSLGEHRLRFLAGNGRIDKALKRLIDGVR